MRLIFLFFILLGFNSAFSLTEILPIPMLIALILFVGLILNILNKGGVPRLKQTNILFVLCFITILLISFAYQVQTLGFQSRGFNHTLSYIAVILLYFVSLELILKAKETPLRKIYKYITFGVLLVSLFTITEFVTKNILGINFDSFIYRPRVEELNATYADKFFRARGPAEEPSYLALYLLMFLPFVIYYYRVVIDNRWRLIASIILVVTAVIFTFSAIAFMEIIIVLIILFFYLLFKKVKKGFTKLEIGGIYILLFSLSVLLTYILYNDTGIPFLEGIFNKIRFHNSVSAEGRIERWIYSISLIKENLFIGSGAGITAIRTGTGSTNMYLEVMTAVGILGFGFFMGIFISSLISMWKIQGKVKIVYLSSFVIMIIHLSSTSQYHNPWIWTLLAIINYHASIQKREWMVYSS